MKKIIATVLAMVMALALCTTAFAASRSTICISRTGATFRKTTYRLTYVTGLTNIDLTVTLLPIGWPSGVRVPDR